MSNSTRRMWLSWRHFLLATISGIAAILISIGSNHLYDAMKAVLQSFDTTCSTKECAAKLAEMNGDAWRGLKHGGWMSLLGVTIAGFLAIPMARRTFSGSTAKIWRVGQGAAPAYRALVLMPSLVGEKRWPLTGKAIELLSNATDKQAALGELCKSTNEFATASWPWQQTLRLIAHNRVRLELVVCLVSEAGAREYAHFEQLLKLAGPSNLRVERIDGHVSINDYNLVEHALQEAIDKCRKDHSVRTKDICIDITSGTRAYSSAATVATLNNPTVFSYVQTRTVGPANAPDADVGEVIIYDASVVS